MGNVVVITNLTLDGVLVQSLMGSRLIDEYVLLIHPLIPGTGRRLFADGGHSTSLTLRQAKTTSKGVVIATYWPANGREAA
ncbi:MAG TPA: dihydrofolate reductase family protein [Gemmatimonadales bacterium]|nr:dihydrofolate reductase family protein [Gemmatimonadales bacterium]